jgi:hypothetical protein
MTYHFTEMTADNQTDWWTREEKGEYLPLFSADQESLVKNVQQLSDLQLNSFKPSVKEKYMKSSLTKNDYELIPKSFLQIISENFNNKMFLVRVIVLSKIIIIN